MLNTIDPNDVFPRRNLPADAEQWGRNVEDRIHALEGAVLQLSQEVAGLSRDIKAVSGNLVTGQQTPFAYTAHDTGETIQYTESSPLYTNTSLVVPAGAVRATLSAKGSCTGRNTLEAVPLEVGTNVFYSHVANWASWSASSVSVLGSGAQTVPVGGVGVAVAQGEITIDVTPGYLLVVGLFSRVNTYDSPPPEMIADAFVSGTVTFDFNS